MGRHPLKEPSNRDFHILEAMRDGHSMAEIGRVYGLTRERIRQIKQRWVEYAPKPKPPLTLKVDKGMPIEDRLYSWAKDKK